MTNEEAINYLKSSGMSEEQIKDIISAFTCEDCISREQAKAAIRDRFKDLPLRVEINTILNDLPSVTLQSKTGHWIEDGYYDLPCVCSYCGHEGRYDIKFCPNCGAKMTESEE